jgi:alpha-ketoglutarate-dependent taurine dioxygenase
MRRQVTGWKAVFVNKGVTKRIIGLSKDESDAILDYLNVCRMTPSFLIFFI